MYKFFKHKCSQNLDGIHLGILHILTQIHLDTQGLNEVVLNLLLLGMKSGGFYRAVVDVIKLFLEEIWKI